MQVKLFFALGADFQRTALARAAGRALDAEPFQVVERRGAERVREIPALVATSRPVELPTRAAAPRRSLPAARARGRTIDLPGPAAAAPVATERPVLVATPVRERSRDAAPSFPFDAGVDAVDPAFLDVTI